MIFLLLFVKVNVSVFIRFPPFPPITIGLLIPVLLLHPLALSCCLKCVHEALSHPGWSSVMIEEMNALDDNGTWDLV